MKRAERRVGLAFTLILFLTGCLPTIPGSIPKIPASQTPGLVPLSSAVFTSTTLPTGSPTPLSTSTPPESSLTSTSPGLISAETFTAIPSFTPTIGQNNVVLLTSTPVPYTEVVTPLFDMTTIFTSPTTLSGSVANENLPSNTVYKQAHIRNISGKPVDITLNCTTNKGLKVVLEYHNVKNLFTNLPEGNYDYVIFVGGRQLMGGFSFISAPKLFMTIYEDRIAIH